MRTHLTCDFREAHLPHLGGRGALDQEVGAQGTLHLSAHSQTRPGVGR